MQKLTAAMILMFVLNSTANADFNSAVAAYERKDFATALAEFTRLAKQGDAQAQYDLALMLANGQGGKRDLTAALGWSLAAQDNGLQKATSVIDQLSRLTNVARAQEAQQYVVRYGPQSKTPNPSVLLMTSVDAPLKALSVGPLSYPDKGVIGWVEALYIVDKDGRIRNSWIKFSMPAGTFERETISWLSQMRFAPPTVDGKPVAVLGSYTLKFTMSGSDVLKLPKLVEWLKQLRGQAENGQPVAQTTLAVFERTYPELSRTLGASDKELSRANGAASYWLSKAAAAGNSTARFEVGWSQLWSESPDTRANAIRNLIEAAQHGSSGAAVLLAVISESEGDVDGEIRAVRWLWPAAKSGYAPAIKMLANLLASSDHDEILDPAAAEMLIKRLGENKDFANDPDIWQISAAAAAGRGDFRAALQFQDKAVAAAKRWQWALEPLLTRRNAYAKDTQTKGLVMSNAVAIVPSADLMHFATYRDTVKDVPVFHARN